MQTPIYRSTIIVGGVSQSQTFNALPDEIITNQSGELILSHYDDSNIPFEISGLDGTALKAVPIETDITPVTMATGSVTYESEIFTLTSANIPATAGTFTLTVAGETTAGIVYNATANDILVALEALPSRSSGDFTVKKISGTNLSEAGTVINIETSGTFAISTASTYDGSGLTGNPSTLNIVQNASDVLNTYRAVWGKDTIPEDWSSYDDFDGPIVITVELEESAGNDTNDDYYQSYQRISVRDKNFKGDGQSQPNVFFDYTWLTAESSDWNKFQKGTPTTLTEAASILAAKGVTDWGTVINMTEVTSPASPSAGDSYIIAGTGGDWSLFTIGNQVTRNSTNDAWQQRVPSEGDFVYDLGTSKGQEYNGTIWQVKDIPVNTDDLPEGSTNLYYTNARVDAHLPDTDSLNEGVTNLYYTDGRVDTRVATIRPQVTQPEIDSPIGTDVRGWSPADVDNFVKTNYEYPYVTGVLSGGEVTIGTPNTTVSVAAGSGIIVNYSNPLNITRKFVSWGAQTNISIPDLTKTQTIIEVDDTGTVILTSQNDIVSFPLRRTRIQLQNAAHTSGVQVDGIGNSRVLAFGLVDALYDYVIENKEINEGNHYEPNGANLNVNKQSGFTTIPNLNQNVDILSPAKRSDPAQTLAPFIPSYRDGVGGFNNLTPTITIDPANYDDGSGTLASVANNQYSNRWFYWFSNNLIAGVVYGQEVYGSLADAVAGIATENPIVDPITDSAVLVTVLSVKGNATDLSDAGQAEFTDITQGTGIGGGTGGGITEPIITLDYSEGSTPPTAQSNQVTMYVDSADKKVKTIDDVGTIRDLTEAAAGVDTTSVNNWTGQQNFSNGNLTDGPSISWDLNTKQVTSVTLAGNRTLANPTNMVTHGTYILKVIQDATGSRTLGFGSAYKWPNDIAPILSTAPNSVTTMTFIEENGFMLGSDIKSYNL